MSTERDGGASSAACELTQTADSPPRFRTALPSMPSGGALFRLAMHSGKLIAAYLRARRREGRGLAWRCSARREGARAVPPFGWRLVPSLRRVAHRGDRPERRLPCFVCVRGHLKHG